MDCILDEYKPNLSFPELKQYIFEAKSRSCYSYRIDDKSPQKAIIWKTVVSQVLYTASFRSYNS
jgi:hypothetical protein